MPNPFVHVELNTTDLAKAKLVDDINAATSKAKSLGATIIREVMEVGGAGWLSIISDPTGAMLGLWKPKSN